MKSLLALAVLVPVFAASAGGPGIGSGKVDMVSPVNLDSNPAWKKFQVLYDSIRNAATVAQLDKHSERRDAIEDSWRKLLPDKDLQSALSRLLMDAKNSRWKHLNPIRGRLPKPDLWYEAGVGFTTLQTRFRIVAGFHRLGMRCALADDLQARLPKMVDYLAHALERAEAHSPEPIPFPEVIISAKEKAAPRPKKKDQIHELIRTVNDSLKAWSGKL